MVTGGGRGKGLGARLECLVDPDLPGAHAVEGLLGLGAVPLLPGDRRRRRRRDDLVVVRHPPDRHCEAVGGDEDRPPAGTPLAARHGHQGGGGVGRWHAIEKDFFGHHVWESSVRGIRILLIGIMLIRIGGKRWGGGIKRNNTNRSSNSANDNIEITNAHNASSSMCRNVGPRKNGVQRAANGAGEGGGVWWGAPVSRRFEGFEGGVPRPHWEQSGVSTGGNGTTASQGARSWSDPPRVRLARLPSRARGGEGMKSPAAEKTLLAGAARGYPPF